MFCFRFELIHNYYYTHALITDYYYKWLTINYTLMANYLFLKIHPSYKIFWAIAQTFKSQPFLLVFNSNAAIEKVTK